jgi:hypothetical protein
MSGMALRFAWDSGKAQANVRRHGVDFNEASSAFADPLSLTIPDPEHSVGEERFLLLGLSSRGRLLVVSHVERGAVIRLVSARLASRNERWAYEEEAR